MKRFIQNKIAKAIANFPFPFKISATYDVKDKKQARVMQKIMKHHWEKLGGREEFFKMYLTNQFGRDYYEKIKRETDAIQKIH